MQWNASGQVSLGYLLAGATCFAFLALRVEPRDPSEDLLPEEGGAPEPPRTTTGVIPLPDASATPPVPEPDGEPAASRPGARRTP